MSWLYMDKRGLNRYTLFRLWLPMSSSTWNCPYAKWAWVSAHEPSAHMASEHVWNAHVSTARVWSAHIATAHVPSVHVPSRRVRTMHIINPCLFYMNRIQTELSKTNLKPIFLRLHNSFVSTLAKQIANKAFVLSYLFSVINLKHLAIKQNCLEVVFDWLHNPFCIIALLTIRLIKLKL